MRVLFTIIVFLNIHILYSQKISETEKLASLCKVWGFLKYYHPNIAKGTFDWDKQLIRKIGDLENVNNKDQLNELYSQWIDELGKVEICSACTVNRNKKYFLKNFNLNWTRDERLFSQEVVKKLLFIENNRNIGEHYYFGKYDRKVFFRNENSYGSKFTSSAIALLELFRYWNYVEYFFPYKYKTDQKWDDVITEMIPKFLSIRNDEAYHLALAELVTKTDDSHAFLFSPLISLNQYGKKKIPVEYSYAEGKLVVTQINANRFNETSALKIGDIIYSIDGKTIPQMVNNFSKYIPASNSWGKLKKVKNLFLFSNNDSIEVRLERNQQNISLKIKTYFFRDIVYEKKPVSEKWKFLDRQKTIGYVNMGIIERADLNEMYQHLATSAAIIFDLRNYPKQTIRPLSLLLLPETSIYYRFIFPETNYPSMFYSVKNSIGIRNTNYYKGDVIVLVNEETQSQAETTAMMLKHHPKAKVIGSNTSGANGDVISFKIAGLGTSFTGLGAYYPDQRETQRIGIIPDIIVKPTVNGIKGGKDEVLERALEYIKTGR